MKAVTQEAIDHAHKLLKEDPKRQVSTRVLLWAYEDCADAENETEVAQEVLNLANNQIREAVARIKELEKQLEELNGTKEVKV